MFDKVRENLVKKAEELNAKVDANKTPPFYESEQIVAVQITIGGVKQALNTVSEYRQKGYRIAGIIEQEAIHASIVLMEKA